MSSINPMILIDKKVNSHLIQKFDSQVNLYVKVTQNHPIQFLGQTVNILKSTSKKDTCPCEFMLVHGIEFVDTDHIYFT
jgi:hypothetical protein